MASFVVTHNADGSNPTATPAKALDIVTTAVSTNSALTGTYGLAQRGLLFLGGMAVQSKRVSGSFNPFA